MIRIAVNGAAGRMGKEIIGLLADHENIELKETIDLSGRTSARSISEVDPSRIDGIIDFSKPAAMLKTAKWCFKNKKFLVSGTTGLSKAQSQQLQRYSKKIPILWAPNLSLGVAALKKVVTELAKLESFDFQIEEIHHRLKKDRPSGTALALQSVLSKSLGRKIPNPISIRGGGIRGIHRIIAMGEGEIITLEHVAMDRAIFARGALEATEFLAKHSNGLFGLEDLWQAKHRKQS